MLRHQGVANAMAEVGATTEILGTGNDHGQALNLMTQHLRGLVMDHVIECPKHNGRFDYRTGRASRAPVCVDLATYPVRVDGGRVMVELP